MSLNLYWANCPNPDKENGYYMGLYMMITGVSKLDEKGMKVFKDRVALLKLIGYTLANTEDGPWYPTDNPEWLAGWAGLGANVEAFSEAKWKNKFYAIAKEEAK